MPLRCQRLLVQPIRFKANAEFVPGIKRNLLWLVLHNSVSSETSETAEHVRAEMVRPVSTEMETAVCYFF